MSVQLAVSVTGEIYTKRGHAKAMKAANRAVMYRVKNQFLWIHFDNVPETYPGSGGYRFKQRTEKYKRWKERKVGHQKPNVLSGRLRDTVLSSSVITATQHGSKLKAKGYFPMTEERRRELEVISKKEQRILTKTFQQDYLKLSRRHPEMIRKRKR